MKKLIINSIIVLLLVVLFPQLIRAQGTITYLSNLEQSSASTDAVGSDSWLAAGFSTGNNVSGYILNSFQLEMTDASGSPSGFTAMLFHSSLGGISPGNSIETLDGSLSPVSAGTYTYNPGSSLTLSPNNDYFIVLTAGTTIANGAYNWRVSVEDSYNPNGGWFAGGGLWTSSNGSRWTQISATYLQYAINATAIPEPSPFGLLLLGSGLFIYARRTSHR
jgi:hypothetical protein